MRIRLLIDVALVPEDVSRLAVLIADQPIVTMQMGDGLGVQGGRLMGATPAPGGGEDGQ